MVDMSESGIGLRELKKQMTRDAIADAALRLALEKGLDHVTIEEIAHVAFVSPRTFSNYFSCKEEAVVAAQFPDAAAVIASFAAGPVDEAPLPALARILSDFVRSLPPEQVDLNLKKIRLGRQHPSLAPHLAGQYSSFEHELRESIAARTGSSSSDDMYPSLVAAAAVSAVRSAIRSWADSGAEAGDLPGLIQDAFSQLEAGLPAPVTTGDGTEDRPARAADS